MPDLTRFVLPNSSFNKPDIRHGLSSYSPLSRLVPFLQLAGAALFCCLPQILSDQILESVQISCDVVARTSQTGHTYTQYAAVTEPSFSRQIHT